MTYRATVCKGIIYVSIPVSDGVFKVEKFPTTLKDGNYMIKGNK